MVSSPADGDDGGHHSMFSQAVHAQPDEYGTRVQDGGLKRSQRAAAKK